MSISGFWGPVVAVVLGLLCFANSAFNGFTYDDNPIVRTNPRIRSLANFREIWLTDWWYERTDEEPILDPSRDRLYRPLTLYSFALNYAVHKLRPMGYHVINVALHAGVCLLVWYFVRRLFGDRTIATIAALLFAVHPVHSEAVAGIVGRGEILAAGFMLLGLLALLPERGPPSIKRVLLASPAFFAALLSKETAACFPAVALVTLHAAKRGRRYPWRWWLMHVGVLLLPLVVYFPLRYYALEEQLVRSELNALLFNPLHDVDVAGRLHGPFTILGHYAHLLIVPSRLSCDYGLAVFNPRQGPEAMTLLGVVAAAALLLGLIGYRRPSPTWRALAVLSALFLVSYALVSNTGLLIGVSLAERLMYWPSVPVLVGVAVGVVGFWRACCSPGGPLRKRASLLQACGILLVLALALRSVVRNSDWQHDEKLFGTDLSSYPLSAHLNNSLARIYIRRADGTADQQARSELIDQAQGLLERALSVRYRYPDALKNLGLVFLLRGDEGQALRYLESSLWLNPTDRAAQHYTARLRGDTRQYETRAAELRRQIEQRPDDPELRLELAEALIKLGGHNAEVLRQCEEAVGLAPDDASALRAYGEALLLNLQREQALEVLRRVLSRDPEDWQTHANVSKLLSERDPVQALHHAQKAYDLQPNHLQTQINLAEALVLNGRLTEALERLRRIERTLPADHPSHRLVTDRIAELERRRR